MTTINLTRRLAAGATVAMAAALVLAGCSSSNADSNGNADAGSNNGAEVVADSTVYFQEYYDDPAVYTKRLTLTNNGEVTIDYPACGEDKKGFFDPSLGQLKGSLSADRTTFNWIGAAGTPKEVTVHADGTTLTYDDHTWTSTVSEADALASFTTEYCS